MNNMPTDSPPAINDCVDLYLHAWDQFGERYFSIEQLIETFSFDEFGILEKKEEAQRHLDMLVNYGMLKHNDGQYWAQCGPEEDLSTWREQVSSPEAIYQLVQQAKRQQNFEPGPDSPEILKYEDESFVSLFADENTDKSDLITSAADKIDQPPASDGIVIRSPADQLGDIQHVADKLCDAKVMTEAGFSYRFEKVISNIRGEHKDDLEYHLYLRLTA